MSIGAWTDLIPEGSDLEAVVTRRSGNPLSVYLDNVS